MFETLLIANRGEIAVRIIRACRELGIRTIAIYSEPDKGAMWTRLADAAHLVGPASARESYLNIQRIVQVARNNGAHAIHPGYGLLSESSAFAQATRDAGLIFVGPNPATIALMGDKVTARHAAIASGVPVLPGSEAAVGSLDEALALADGIGWPVAVKASFGGGGRGLRVALDRSALESALEQASREATAAFGRGEVFLERYLVRPRHIEVQVLGDSHGSVIHLGDRDCSVQRRHQKLLEEAPAPALSDSLRSRIQLAAVTLCRSVHYEGAGTVEFLVDVASDVFYFLEMNTRLQVEHGVSELVTGIDIVKQQIVLAAGSKLAILQSDVQMQGHAIQARIAAEDPWEEFRPAPGQVSQLVLPTSPWVRCDFGLQAGDSIQPHYDSMFGKVLAWGNNRQEARRRLALALDDMVVRGVPTTAPYLGSVLNQPAFSTASHDTGSLERDWAPDPARRPVNPAPIASITDANAVMIERRVTVPWGGQFVDVSIFSAGSVSSGPGLGAGRPRSRSDNGSSSNAADQPHVRAPMDAVVIKVLCDTDQLIAKGDQLMILEAMKMEVIITALHAGRIDTIFAKAGVSVKSGATLLTIRASL